MFLLAKSLNNQDPSKASDVRLRQPVQRLFPKESLSTRDDHDRGD